MAIIIKNIAELDQPLQNPVLTIGNFDGVHKGHKALFDKVKERAAAIAGQSVVMTFDPHPIKVMRPDSAPPLITPIEQKLRLIKEAGVDVIICLPFDREFAQIGAREFVEKILVEKIGIKELVVGYDYTFGRNREGNIGLLRKLGDELGFKVHVLDPVYVEGRLVSSTSIRNLVRGGNLDEARILLGRDYEVCGTVVRGRNRGARLLGFPTANLNLIDELIPKEGVYAVEVIVPAWPADRGQECYPGVTNIGRNPTFGNGALSIETHILDFSGDLLGQVIRVKFIQRLRDERKFESIEALSSQIAKDVERAKEILGYTDRADSKAESMISKTC